jgi:hypothetical protein
MTPEEAEAALQAWATVQRDELVREARHAGVSKYRISQITGIARPTIDRILKTPGGTPGEKITAYLDGFTAEWPRPRAWELKRLTGIASAFTPDQIAGALLADARFRELKLGTWLSTPASDVLAAAVRALAPPLLPGDADVLLKALELASRRQHEEARQKLAAGLLGGAALALVIGSGR